jgi:hypothetical protein
MSVAQTRAARRRMNLRYHNGRSSLTVAESIARERQKAARAAAARKK